MAETEYLKNMVLCFRKPELKVLLGYAGQRNYGEKLDLQARALRLLPFCTIPIKIKIRELYKNMSSQEDSSEHSEYLPSIQSQCQQQQQMQHQAQAASRSNAFQAGGYPVAVLAGGNLYSPNTVARLQSHSNFLLPPPVAHDFFVHPNVRMKRLPFYDLVEVLLKPSRFVYRGDGSLQKECFVFRLTVEDIARLTYLDNREAITRLGSEIQVQLRFSRLDLFREQDDFFPPGVSVKVNGKECELPDPTSANIAGVGGLRPSQPVDITALLRLSTIGRNHISVSWCDFFHRGYTAAVYLVRKLTPADLLQRLKSRRVSRSVFTRGLIDRMLRNEYNIDILTTSVQVSLMCPLGKIRMTTPCRASTCNHLQCFDAHLYLKMNEKKSTWMCPVCNKPALYDELMIDEYFQNVLGSNTLPSDCNEIKLNQDGSWSPLVVEERNAEECASEVHEAFTKTEEEDVEVIFISDDVPKLPKANYALNKDVVDLTVESDDDDMQGPSKKAKKN